MRELVDAKSEAEGRNSSRLPTFDSTWTEIITGKCRFTVQTKYLQPICI